MASACGLGIPAKARQDLRLFLSFVCSTGLLWKLPSLFRSYPSTGLSAVFNCFDNTAVSAEDVVIWLLYLPSPGQLTLREVLSQDLPILSEHMAHVMRRKPLRLQRITWFDAFPSLNKPFQHAKGLNDFLLIENEHHVPVDLFSGEMLRYWDRRSPQGHCLV